MSLAENKYKALLSLGEWKSPQKDQKEVLALIAQVEDLKKKNDTNCNSRLNWNQKAPSDLEATKTYKSREYNWCPKQEMWSFQMAEDCKLPDLKREGSTGNGDNDNRKKKWEPENELVAMQEKDNSTVEWLLCQWLIRFINMIITAYSLTTGALDNK